MSKVKFEPGKRVLVLGPGFDPTSWHVVGKDCRLGQEVGPLPQTPDRDHWELAGERSTDGYRIAWPKSKLILLDPDETPEQSAEAMRDLHSLPQKVTA